MLLSDVYDCLVYCKPCSYCTITEPQAQSLEVTVSATCFHWHTLWLRKLCKELESSGKCIGRKGIFADTTCGLVSVYTMKSRPQTSKYN